MQQTRVVNMHHKVPYDVYIGRGRGSIWGNPFSHMGSTKAEFKTETREEAVEAYRQWIAKQPHLLARLHELKGKTLACWCAPAACHGHVLAELADSLPEEESCTMGNKIEKVSFTGHRPQKLRGFDWNNPWLNQTTLEVRDILTAAIEDYIRKGAHTFITGGAIGVDQIAFYSVQALKRKYPHLKNIVAVPFRKQDGNWNHILKEWYHKLLQQADEIVYVDETGIYYADKPIGEYSALKMQQRNQWMVDHSDAVIAFWDGTPGGTGNCVKYAQEQNKEIHRVHFPVNSLV